MEKYRIYIDEVGNSDMGSSNDPNHRYLSLTGIIFELSYVQKVVSTKLDYLKQKFFDSHPDEPIILHRKELVNKKYPFKKLKNPEIEKEFNREFLEILKDLEYTIITVLIDKLEHKSQYTVWTYNPYHYCLAVLVERYFRFLSNKNSIGDIMIESRGGKEDIRLKKSYRKIYDEGTSFIKPDLFQKVLTSKELKVKPKSSNIAGLQLADLIAYPARQYIFDIYGIEKKLKPTFNDYIIGVIESKFYNLRGEIKGYGIKILP